MVGAPIVAELVRGEVGLAAEVSVDAVVVALDNIVPVRPANRVQPGDADGASLDVFAGKQLRDVMRNTLLITLPLGRKLVEQGIGVVGSVRIGLGGTDQNRCDFVRDLATDIHESVTGREQPGTGRKQGPC